MANLEKASTAHKVSGRSIALEVNSSREDANETGKNCKNKGIKKEMVREKINERKKSRKDM